VTNQDAKEELGTKALDENWSKNKLQEEVSAWRTEQAAKTGARATGRKPTPPAIKAIQRLEAIFDSTEEGWEAEYLSSVEDDVREKWAGRIQSLKQRLEQLERSMKTGVSKAVKQTESKAA
jgi:flagellar biosynthesis/type III secretory pathway protein FliH